ncbi:MAG TPA: S9 family peptidase [Allosphingosinicella sp.]|jgi:dipeptidyl aminopeptidase/acylaminoacyl peptidase
MLRIIAKWAAAVAASLTAMAAAAAVPERIPVEAFGALANYASPEISPDGKRIVAVAVAGEQKAVIVYDIEGDPSRFTRIDLGEKFEVMALRWAGNRRVLLSVFGKGKVMGFEVPMIRLFLRDLDTGELKALAGGKVGGLYGGEIVFVDPAGAYVLLSAQRGFFESPSVLRVDLATLKSTQIAAAQPGVWSWYADPTGTVRAGLGSDIDSWWLYYRERDGQAFRKIKGKRSAALSLTNLETLVPIASSNKGYAIANKTTGRYGVYRYDFLTDTLGEPVFEHPRVDVDSIVRSQRTGEPDAILYTDERERTAWLDKAMQAIQDKIDKALPGRSNRIVSRDATDGMMVVRSTAGSDPGTYYLYDRAKRSLAVLATAYDSLDGKPLAPVEPVTYPARDGLAIPAYLTKPLGRGGRGLPLIVLPHGGPFIRDTWTYNPWVQFLANRGYAVLQPNFRGSTGYGKAFVDAASGEFGRKMQDDLDDGVRWLVGQGIVDSKRVCIMGASYGGYASLWAAARNPDIYRCSISLAGVSDIRSMLRYDPSTWIARRYYRDWRDRIRGDSKFDLEKVSPLALARDIRIPLLIAHGKDDTRVPPSQSTKLHEALQKLGRPHEYVLYPEEGHGFSKPANSVDFLRRVERFLAEHNPAD